MEAGIYEAWSLGPTELSIMQRCRYFWDTLKGRIGGVLLYIMKTSLSNKGSITPNAYRLISEQIILGQVRYSHFTQGCSRYLHSSWRYKKTEWNNTLQPQFFCDRSKYWSFLHRVTADTRSVHGAMKCICKLVWRGLKTNYFSLTSP